MTDKSYPTEAIFILCEEVREEKKGTKTFVDVYPNRQVGVPEGAKQVSLTLSLIWIFNHGEGSYSYVIELDGPSVRLKSPPTRCESTRDAGMTVGLNLRPGPPMAPGRYTVTCRLDDHEYTSSLEIRAGIEVKAPASSPAVS